MSLPDQEPDEGAILELFSVLREQALDVSSAFTDGVLDRVSLEFRHDREPTGSLLTTLLVEMLNLLSPQDDWRMDRIDEP